MTTTGIPTRHAPAADEPIAGLSADVAARQTAEQGSTRLLAAIDRLVAKTARDLNVPPQFARRRVAFAKAYLGMECETKHWGSGKKSD